MTVTHKQLSVFLFAILFVTLVSMQFRPLISALIFVEDNTRVLKLHIENPYQLCVSSVSLSLLVDVIIYGHVYFYTCSLIDDIFAL